jgi:hypothetical protein
MVTVPYEALALALFVARIGRTEDSHNAVATYDFAVFADFLD